jgi:oligopeptidase B
MASPAADRDATDDPYAWMRDDERLAPYLDAERAYYDAGMEPLADLTGTVLAELIARTPDTERSAPRDVGDYSYYSLTRPGQELPELRRRARSSNTRDTTDTTDTDELILDLASFGSPYAVTGVEEPGPDLYAYSLDLTGEERYTLRFRDLDTATDLPLEVADTSYSGTWIGEDFYTTVIDELHRPHEVHRYRPRTGEHELILTEPDDRFWLSVRRSGDRLVISAQSRTTSESWTLDDGEIRSLRPRVEGVEYDVEWDRDRWLHLSNADATEFALTADASPTAPALDIRHGRVHEVVAFDDAIVTYARVDGEAQIRILNRDSTVRHELRPDAGGSIRLGRNEDPHASFATIVTGDYATPSQWWDVDLVTGQRTLRHEREVPAHDPRQYVSETVYAVAADGWQIPIVTTRRRDTPLDGSAPCLLYGYGAYEVVDDPGFDPGVLPLLDRGVVFAKAHVRGGGEVSRQQWLDGRLTKKRNTFTDFIAAADFLAGDGGRPALVDGPALVNGDRIVARGGSAGGLLVGAVYALAPQRWAGVIAEVPFVDVVTTMSDPDLPLTIVEWEEWGDPRITEQRDYMASYAPYLNLPPAADRPALLATGAVNDPRVLVHEPAKWVAALRHSDPAHGDRPAITERGSIAFRVETGEGSHGGQAGRYAALAEEAEVVAWSLMALGAADLGADTKV